MPMLTLGEAARACGIPKSTISRAIKSGRLSAGRDDKGSYAIDPAELFRVYDPKSSEDATSATGGVSGGVVQDTTGGVGAPGTGATPADYGVALRLAAAEAELRGLKEMVEELRRSRDKWEAQAERLTLTLPAPQQVVQPARVPERRGWWPFGRRAGWLGL
jgi:hypothetical protein